MFFPGTTETYLFSHGFPSFKFRWKLMNWIFPLFFSKFFSYIWNIYGTFGPMGPFFVRSFKSYFNKYKRKLSIVLFSWKFYIFWKYWDMFWSHGILFHQTFNELIPDLFSISSNMAMCSCSRKPNRGVFRIQSNMYDGPFLRRVSCFYPFTVFAKKLHLRYSTWL